MISVTELKSGTIFEEGGNILQVLTYTHTKMGRGSASIKVKVKNLKSGSITEKNFISGAKVNNVSLFKRDVRYLYKDDFQAYFMDPKTFDQVSIPLRQFGQDAHYLKEGESFNVSFLGDEPLALNLSPKKRFWSSRTPLFP